MKFNRRALNNVLIIRLTISENSVHEIKHLKMVTERFVIKLQTLSVSIIYAC